MHKDQVLIFTMMLFILLVGASPMYGKDVVQETHQDEQFIALFHGVRWGTWKNISSEAEPYLMGRTQDDASAILVENDFSVRIVDDLSNVNLDSEDRNAAIDRKVLAERGPGWHFWRIFTKYRVYLSIKDRRVIRVTAIVDSATFLP